MRVRCIVILLMLGAFGVAPPGGASSHGVTIVSPADGASLVGTVTVSGSLQGDDVTHVQISVDDPLGFVPVDDWTPGSATWSHTLDTTGYVNGAHAIRVRARDAGGSMAEDRVSVVFENPVVVDLVFRGMVDAPIGLERGTIRFVVANEGTSAVADAVARAEFAYQGRWHVIGDAVFDLESQGSDAVTIQWASNLHVGRFPVRVTLDPDHVIPEAQEDNNVGEGEASFWTDAISGVWLVWPVSPDPQEWPTKIVRIMDATFGFQPALYPTRVTDYLLFWNQDDVVHSVVADDGSFARPEIEPGSPAQVFFDEPGVYAYHCAIHPHMTGRILVLG